MTLKPDKVRLTEHVSRSGVLSKELGVGCERGAEMDEERGSAF